MIRAILVNLIFAFFAIGLLGAGNLMAQKIGLAKNKGNGLILGLLVYMLTCNAALLLPPLLERLPFAAAGSVAQISHSILILSLEALIIALAAIGLICQVPAVNRKHIFRQNLVLRSIRRINSLDLSIIIVAILCYWFVVVKGDGMNGDTGLYHMPHVFHLGKIGLEWGLANWDLRYTTYSILFYGQAPLQELAGSAYASPSLNILFFASLLMYAKEAILLDSLNSERRGSPSGLRRFASCGFFFLAIVYGLEPRSSLVSFNPDFAIGCLSSIAIYDISAGGGFKEGLIPSGKSTMLVHVATLWLLKLTSIFSIFCIFAIFALSCLFSKFAAAPPPPTVNDQQLRSLPVNNKSIGTMIRFKCLGVLLIVSIAVYSLSAMVATGYLLPKQQLLGPLHEYSLDAQLSKDFALGELRFNRTRWYGQSDEEIKAVDANPEQWFRYWKSSKEGKILLGSIGLSISCLAILAINSLILRLQGKGKAWAYTSSIKIAVIAGSIALTGIFAVFFGPPQLRFFTWILSTSFYCVFASLLVSPLLSWTCWLTISSILFIAGQKGLLEKIPVPQSKTEERAFQQRWKWKSRSAREGKIRYTQITDAARLCWSAPTPCSTARSFDPDAKD